MKITKELKHLIRIFGMVGITAKEFTTMGLLKPPENLVHKKKDKLNP